MSDYRMGEDGHFVIHNYNQQTPMASFLPGIAGPMGIPMWVFYVNRGQAIASFGVESKDAAIMEFQPANKAYQQVHYLGFRTFLKFNGQYYEPFAPNNLSQRNMKIGMNELALSEIALDQPITANLTYFIISDEPFAGLVRHLTLTNHGSSTIDLSVLDGLPVIVPFGVENWLLKDLARTSEAWMGVLNVENSIPFYRVRSSIVDKVEVASYEAGHFYAAFTDRDLLSAIVDPEVVFGQNTSLSQADGFLTHSLQELYKLEQITVGKTPCGFFGTESTLSPGKSLDLYSIIGHVNKIEIVQREAERICQLSYVNTQHTRARDLVKNLTDTIAINTGEPRLDAYARQTFLDNVLRGGWPITFKNTDPTIVQHIYSRKHGDLERDYNSFFLAPEFFSQGNGNYRDINQNRREDVWLNPQIGDYNIKCFLNLIQADGYNPLVVYGNRFTISAERRPAILSMLEDSAVLEEVLEQPFTPGLLLKTIAVAGLRLKTTPEEFLVRVLQNADRHFHAVFGEGYWVDHWTYNLDLIKNYLAIYPDKKETLLFADTSYTFFDSDRIVQPRSQKYVIHDGRLCQLNAIVQDERKSELISSRKDNPNVLCLENGQGEIFRTTLFIKLLCIVLTKFSTLDPFGMGIEMEAGKPGWYDALNGLPGLFGSSMPETFELKRVLAFLRTCIAEYPSQEAISLPVEMFELLQALEFALQAYPQLGDMAYWDTVATARENYRARVFWGLEGDFRSISLADLDMVLSTMELKIQQGIERAYEMNGGFPPTYFIFQPVESEEVDGAVIIRRFAAEVLPPFLEGPVHALKTTKDTAAALHLHQQVRESDLFDQKLKMYKVNASLADQPLDIGRARAFTPGWLENESIWLHMEYKYLMAMLDAELLDAFYEDFRHVLIPFQNPEVYGRSTLENVSFIVSSAHPDSRLHGRGFVARLSGSTVEFLNILHRIMIGKCPFFTRNNTLCLKFDPAVPGWLFNNANRLSFTFLGNIKVEYHNPTRGDTFGNNATRPVQHVLTSVDGSTTELETDTLTGQVAENVREGLYRRIEVTLR